MKIPPRILGLIDSFERVTVKCAHTARNNPQKPSLEAAKSAAKARLIEAVMSIANPAAVSQKSEGV